MNRYVNPANAITAARYLTLAPFVYWLDRGQYQYAILMVALCGGLDLIDGAVARLFNCASDFGALLDAITDAICFGFFMVVLAIDGLLPLVPVAGILSIGVINTIFRAIYARRVGRPVNYRSYAMERLVAYTVYLIGFGVADFEAEFFSWVTFIMMVIVVLHDSKRMLIDPVPQA